ncbi:hypothetical protein D9M72_614370 [compost metagenome]
MRLRPSRPTSTSGASGGGADAPIDRRNRSVGQVGRESETTLLITGFQDKIRAFAGAGPDQLDQPAGAADTRYRQGFRRQGRESPARDGRGRLAEIAGV